MLLEPKKEIIYGPVNSRRLGRSLGINLMPGGVKVCSFNCVYCQYGWTRVHEIGEKQRAMIPKTEDVVRAVEGALRSLDSSPAYVTFSGNGEPSLHPDFPEIAEAVNGVRSRLAPGAKTAILSNSSTAGEERTRRALTVLDVRIMKLDCGTNGVFRRTNGPALGLTLDMIAEGLADLSRLAPVTIQSLWAGGPGGNYSLAQVEAWIGRLSVIRPASVQVYSLDRDTPSRDLQKLGEDELEGIRARARAAGFRTW